MQPTFEEEQKTGVDRVLNPMTETFGLSRWLAGLVIFLIVLVLGLTIFWFFHSAPPRKLVITAGPDGSMFRTNAEDYKRILASNGVTLEILTSNGSEENLRRLEDPKFRVDIGFVQGGVTNVEKTRPLVSLGSVNYEPLLVFYRGTNSLTIFSDMKGKRLAIGPQGSGTRSLAMALLKMNGLTNADSFTDLTLDAVPAAQGLIDGSVDVVFLMGDSASPQLMGKLLRTPGIHLMDITQADGYTRRINYLTKLAMPMGSIDFGKNIPSRDVSLIGPTVELLARPNLNSALSDLLLDAVRKVNGKPGLFKRKNEFPFAMENDWPISADAARFYKSGKSLFYSSFERFHIPFWLASLVNRILVSFVPLILVVIPGLKLVPALYKWRIRLLFYRRYRALLMLERELLAETSPHKRQELMEHLDQIEKSVNKMKLPASFANQFYDLRGHVIIVRNRVTAALEAK